MSSGKRVTHGVLGLRLGTVPDVNAVVGTGATFLWAQLLYR